MHKESKLETKHIKFSAPKIERRREKIPRFRLSVTNRVNLSSLFIVLFGQKEVIFSDTAHRFIT